MKCVIDNTAFSSVVDTPFLCQKTGVQCVDVC